MNSITIRTCQFDAHSAAIQAIFNHAIVHSTALYEYAPRTDADMAQWFAEKDARGFPVLGAFDAQDQLLGFATYGVFRSKPAYKYTVEHSVYIHHDHQGKGLGRALLQALIEHAQASDIHCLIGAIDAANFASIHLHEQLGFEPCGTLREVGFKFGEWLDVAFYQLLLPTPESPIDG